MAEPSSSVSAARRLRRVMTDAERAMWKELHHPPFADFRFRRQHPIAGYVVDFASDRARLIVELDGGQHADSEKDRERDRRLARLGWRVVRFWNHDVLQNIGGVLQNLRTALSVP